jgi:selenocysteine lyase/cysteine desulfurase
MGLPMERGDEALYAGFEYGSMKVAFEQRAAREGIRVRELGLDATELSDDEIVEAYRAAITDRTRVLLVSHVVYLTGQVLPVRRISDMAHERGVEVIVDGAHGFTHLADGITDLRGDYYAASLHKWMGAPLGTGILHVRKAKIAGLWPLFGDARYASDAIEKLAHIGTWPVYAPLAVLEAIRFNEELGLDCKEARLRYLKNRWVERLEDVPGIVLRTPKEDGRSCALALAGVEGIEHTELADTLLERYGIFTVAVEGGCRIAPNLYTSVDEIDLLVAAMTEIASG